MTTLMRALLAAAVFFPTALHAASWVQDRSFGVESKTCEDWVRDRSFGPQVWNGDAEWMFGFITALVRAEGASGKGGMTGEDFPNEIDELCKMHPHMDLAGIAQIFVEQHQLVSKHIAVTE